MSKQQERKRTLNIDHEPVIGTTSFGSAIVGCSCMDAREFFALVDARGGPAYAVWATHFTTATGADLTKAEGETFTCPRCGAVSHHPDDVANRYCARCNVFIDGRWS